MALRTITTDGLKCLGTEGYGPWRLGDDCLLRTSSHMVPFTSEAQARTIYDIYHTTRLAGAPTPDALEVVRVEGGYGVVVEYVPGLPLGTHVLIGSYSIEDAGRAMGSLAHDLNSIRMETGFDWGTFFTQRAYELSALMSPEAGERLITLVENIPPSATLIHGDLHVVNVVVHNSKCHLIDIEAAGFGHPTFELAIARSRLIGAANRLSQTVGIDRDESDRMWQRMWRALLRGYFDGADESTLDELDQRFEVLALIELCRLMCKEHQGNTDHPDNSLKKLLGANIQRIEELLPHVERLDF